LLWLDLGVEGKRNRKGNHRRTLEHSARDILGISVFDPASTEARKQRAGPKSQARVGVQRGGFRQKSPVYGESRKKQCGQGEKRTGSPSGYCAKISYVRQADFYSPYCNEPQRGERTKPVPEMGEKNQRCRSKGRQLVRKGSHNQGGGSNIGQPGGRLLEALPEK